MRASTWASLTRENRAMEQRLWMGSITLLLVLQASAKRVVLE
jgi:hypothetical protein